MTRTQLPGNADDKQARYIEAAVSGVLVVSIYLPNGNPQPRPKFDYKLAWFEHLIAHAATLLAEGVPAVLAGDYKVVPIDLDIYPPTSWGENALLQPENRAAFALARPSLDHPAVRRRQARRQDGALSRVKGEGRRARHRRGRAHRWAVRRHRRARGDVRTRAGHRCRAAPAARHRQLAREMLNALAA